jgi:Flp pilus assembly protein TadG
MMDQTPSSPHQGQALTELALVLPILLVLLMAVLDFGRAIYAYNAISNAAREGGRTAIVNQTLADIRARAAAQATGVGIDPADTTCDPADNTQTDCVFVEFRNEDLSELCSPPAGNYGCVAVVTVKHTFTPLTPIIGQIWSSIALGSTTKQPIESVCVDGAVTCPVP